VPVAPDSGLNYSQVERGRTLIQERQEIKAVSLGGFNHNQVDGYSNRLGDSLIVRLTEPWTAELCDAALPKRRGSSPLH
jgi:hypothetical protein